MIIPRRAVAIPLLLLLLFIAAILATGVTGAEDTVPSQQPLVLNLDKAIALALAQNRDVLIADEDRDKAVAQIDAERSGVYPQINVTGQYTRNVDKPVLFMAPNTPLNQSSSTKTFELGSDNAYQLTASLSQALFNRKDRAALEIARTYHDFSEEAFRATRQDVTLAVRKAFYGVLLAREVAEANRQGIETVRANLESVQSLYRHGSVAEYDLLRAEVQVANTEPLVTSADNNLVLAEVNLKNLLAIPSNQAVEVEGELRFDEIPPETMDLAESNALSTNPSVVQLKLQESMFERKIGIEKANRFPTLNLVGACAWQAQDNTFRLQDYGWARISNVGLQLSYPLFDGFKTSSHIRQALIDLKKTHYVRLRAEEGLRVQIQSARLRMAEAKKRIKGQERNTEQARKAVHIAQTRYKNGVGTQLELSDSQVAMTRAQMNYSQAVCDYLIAAAEWRRCVGFSA